MLTLKKHCHACEFFCAMPHRTKASVRKRSSPRGKGLSRKPTHRIRRYSVEPHRIDGAATFRFGANDFQDQNGVCDKRYLSIDKGPVSDAFAYSLADLLAIEGRTLFGQHIAPNDATSLSVTWNLQEVQANQNDLTRYIISVERYTGCVMTPIVKFQVPVSEVPVDDCTVVLKSKLRGTTQPFCVKVCAGDRIFVAISMILAEDCPVQCGVPISGATPSTNVTALSVAFVSVYLV